ncbi:hypothetical protein [Actinocorallia longicatena]|uniref:hypothetical protein n=1 Tax=Actinocorallia longicatena TaxID=111803 RepID=UPI0031DB4E79
MERLVQARLELPAFSTLDAMESRIRGQVNEAICRKIWTGLGAGGRVRMQDLPVPGPDGKSPFNELKKPAKRPTWTKFRDQQRHLEWVDGRADTDVLARSYHGEAKRLALITCLVHQVRGRVGMI